MESFLFSLFVLFLLTETHKFPPLEFRKINLFYFTLAQLSVWTGSLIWINVRLGAWLVWKYVFWNELI